HLSLSLSIFLSNPPSPSANYTLSLHDALPIYPIGLAAKLDDLAPRHGDAFLAVEHHRRQHQDGRVDEERDGQRHGGVDRVEADGDRKSTRLNSSHVKISYAVFCLKKKKNRNDD